jgi:hypothetical protein
MGDIIMVNINYSGNTIVFFFFFLAYVKIWSCFLMKHLKSINFVRIIITSVFKIKQVDINESMTPQSTIFRLLVRRVSYASTIIVVHIDCKK